MSAALFDLEAALCDLLERVHAMIAECPPEFAGQERRS